MDAASSGARRGFVRASLPGVLKGNNAGCRQLLRQIIRGLAVPNLAVPGPPARGKPYPIFIVGAQTARGDYSRICGLGDKRVRGVKEVKNGRNGAKLSALRTGLWEE